MLRYLYEYEFYHAKSIWQHKMIIKLETIQVWIVSDNIGHHIGHEIDNLIVHQIEISITVDEIIITTRRWICTQQPTLEQINKLL